MFPAGAAPGSSVMLTLDVPPLALDLVTTHQVVARLLGGCHITDIKVLIVDHELLECKLIELVGWL